MDKKINTSPKPWRTSRYLDGRQTIVTDCEGFDVCRVSANGPDIKTRDSNTRLIMAAPELLSVCMELAESAEYWSEYDVPIGIVDKLNSAIKKAVG